MKRNNKQRYLQGYSVIWLRPGCLLPPLPHPPLPRLPHRDVSEQTCSRRRVEGSIWFRVIYSWINPIFSLVFTLLTFAFSLHFQMKGGFLWRRKNRTTTTTTTTTTTSTTTQSVPFPGLESSWRIFSFHLFIYLFSLPKKFFSVKIWQHPVGQMLFLPYEDEEAPVWALLWTGLGQNPDKHKR